MVKYIPPQHLPFFLALHREASIHAATIFVEHVSDLTPHLAYLFPVLMARGASAGSLYDPALELFVHNNEEHEAYKRCVACDAYNVSHASSSII